MTRVTWLFSIALPLAVVAIALFGSSAASAQSIVSIPQFGTYDGTIDTIDEGNLNVSIRLPLFTFNARGVGKEDVYLLYSGTNIGAMITGYPVGSSSSGVFTATNWALNWGAGYGGVVGVTTNAYQCQDSNQNVNTVDSFTYSFTDQRGVTSEFPGTSENTQCNTVAGEPYTTLTAVPDGRGNLLVSANGYSVTVQDASGNTYQYGGEGGGWDSNGNPFTGGSLPTIASLCSSDPYYPATPSANPGVACPVICTSEIVSVARRER